MHLHVSAWLHSCLAAHNNDGGHFVKTELKSLYPEKEVEILSTDEDFGYLMYDDNSVVCAISGTKNNRAWLSNVQFLRPVHGIHRKWNEAWYDCFAHRLFWVINNISKSAKFDFFGHSRGDAIALRGALWAREEMKLDKVEKVGFCGPMLLDREGVKRCKRVKLCATRFWIDGIFTDITDDIGVIGGKHYGYPVRLPNPPNKKPFWDHAYSNVTWALTQKLIDWKLPIDAAGAKYYGELYSTI